MHKPNPDFWVWMLRPPPGPQPSGSFSTGTLCYGEEEEEEEEEEAGEHPAVCCYTAGGPSLNTPAYSGIPSGSGLAGGGPEAPSSEQPITVIDWDQGDFPRHVNGAHCWEGPGMDTQGCVCNYGEGEPEGSLPRWPAFPHFYYGLRRNLVVGVQVVEEVAVEETLEVITEDVYTGDQLDPELL